MAAVNQRCLLGRRNLSGLSARVEWNEAHQGNAAGIILRLNRILTREQNNVNSREDGEREGWLSNTLWIDRLIAIPLRFPNRIDVRCPPGHSITTKWWLLTNYRISKHHLLRFNDNQITPSNKWYIQIITRGSSLLIWQVINCVPVSQKETAQKLISHCDETRYKKKFPHFLPGT